MTVCPKCKSTHGDIIDTRRFEDTVRRRRRCLDCGVRWSTIERFIKGSVGDPPKKAAERRSLAISGVPPTVRFAVLQRDSFRCRYCRATGVTLVVDHVVPASAPIEDATDRDRVLAWRHSMANLVTACEPCNAGKGDGLGVQPPPDEGGE